jgi:hypothetical protein
MNGCFPVEEEKERPKFCIACNQILPCKCMWNELREIRTTQSILMNRVTALELKAAHNMAPEVQHVVNNGLKAEQQRIDKLESTVSILERYTKTIGMLCDHKNYQIDENKKISRRVDELEKVFICFKQDFETSMEYMKAKHPHKCPICDGMRKFKVFGKDIEADCPACEGKGIVWE